MRRFRVMVDGEVFEVDVEEMVGDGKKAEPQLKIEEVQRKPSTPRPVADKKPAQLGENDVVAPIPGVVTSVNVALGAKVSKGQVLVILEAMKMQNEILAPSDGTVENIPVSRGQSVKTGDILVRLN